MSIFRAKIANAEQPAAPPRPLLPAALHDFFAAVAPATSPLSQGKGAKPAENFGVLPPPVSTGAHCVQNMAEMRIRQWIFQHEAEQRRQATKRPPSV